MLFRKVYFLPILIFFEILSVLIASIDHFDLVLLTSIRSRVPSDLLLASTQLFIGRSRSRGVSVTFTDTVTWYINVKWKPRLSSMRSHIQVNIQILIFSQHFMTKLTRRFISRETKGRRTSYKKKHQEEKRNHRVYCES